MPPKKEVKEKQVKGDEADELVLNYLKSVNRPYASTDVSANLMNKVPKAAAQKIMQALADKGEITVKPYGKQTIFVYNQVRLHLMSSLLPPAVFSHFHTDGIGPVQKEDWRGSSSDQQEKLPVMSPEDMSSLDAEVKAAQDSLKDQKERLKELEKNLAQAESIPKTKDLPAVIQQIEEENQLTLRTLAPYRKTGDEPQIKPLSPEEIKQIDADFVKWRKQWVDRRKVYNTITGAFADGGVMINNEWREDQGITGDDEEAIAIENGEFCKPQATVRPAARARPKGISPPSSASTAVSRPAAPSKRAASDAQSSQDAKPKKKVKKAAATAA